MKTYTLHLLTLTLCIALSCCITNATWAEVQLPQIFGDNMVLQRNKLVIIWGTATTKAEKIVVRIAGRTYRTRAANDSTWSVALQPTQEGGPYTLEINGDNKIVFRNVMFGDVWLCSGQNNMDMSLNKSAGGQKELLRAEYPMIRLFMVKKRYSTRPIKEVVTENGWMPCDIETAAAFSATAYYFGKELFNNQPKVPIGLIQATYNGSKIESWLSPDVLKTFPDLKEKVEFIENHPDYLLEKKKEYEESNLKKWFSNLEKLDEGFRDSTGGGWESPDLNTRDWSEMYQPKVWASRGNELADYSGSVWFRKKFTLPEILKGKDLSLHLGPLHDYDFTYINGKKIGESYIAETNRTYKIPKEFLKEKDNEIVVFSIHFGGEGGFSGIADQMYIRSTEKDDPIRFSLAGNWKFRVGFQLLDGKNLPYYPQFRGERNEPALVYNAMIAPLHKFAIRGIVWSQGEANVGMNKARIYQEYFLSLIQNWREKWRREAGIMEDLPFLFTQLSSYGKPSPLPSENSNWAEMREAQATISKMKGMGIATTIDLGEEDNMFYREKHEVGKRLAYQAFKLLGEKKNFTPTGPTLESSSITQALNGAAGMRLTFKMAGGGLIAKNQYGYLEGFSIAEEGGKFHWAKAYIVGYNTVIVYNENVKNPAYVRYAWSDYPQANLFNKEGLPALPFKTDNRLYMPPPANAISATPDE